MQLEPRMPHQPCLDGGMFVDSLVVQDQMHVQAVGHLGVDDLEEGEELGVAVFRQA